MKATDVKKGNVIEHNNNAYQVRDIEKSSAQGRGGNVTYRFTLYSIANGSKLDLSLRADDDVQLVPVDEVGIAPRRALRAERARALTRA